VYNCLHGKAPSYLTDCCTPISDVASRRHLRSASRRQLLVPRNNLSTYGRRAFSIAGPAAWNCLSDELREPLLTVNSFRQLLNTRLFAVGSVALLVARRTNDRKVAGSRPTKVLCIIVLTGNRMGVNCLLWPAATPSSEL